MNTIKQVIIASLYFAMGLGYGLFIKKRVYVAKRYTVNNTPMIRIAQNRVNAKGYIKEMQWDMTARTSKGWTRV